MAITLTEYFNLGVGDKVRIVSLDIMEQTPYYQSGQENFAGQEVIIADIYDDYFYIEGGTSGFDRACIEEVLEHNAEYRLMSLGVYNHLQRGDKVLLHSYSYIASSWHGSRQMADYGGTVVTFREPYQSRCAHIVEDRQRYTWHYDLMNKKVLKYKEPTQEEIEEALSIKEYEHELTIKSAVLESYEKLNQLELIKVTDDIEKIVSYSNTRRFAEYIAGKWVIISKYNYRIYNELNPHIAKGLQFLQCSNWKLDYYWALFEESKILSDKPLLNKVLQVNFKTGEIIDVLLTDKTRCCVCGVKLDTVEHEGRYCHSCLTMNRGFAYRFGYHDYNEGYSVLENVDTKKVAVFGCEIERDYIPKTAYSHFGDNCSKAMIDILRETQSEQLANGNLKREQVFMSDGSLNSGGIEWITFPHTFDWYIANKDKLDKALLAIKERGFKGSIRAGNHIHINRDFFTNKNGKCTAKYCASKMAVLINRYWDCFLAIARRTRTTYTAKPSQEYDDDIFTIVEKTIRSENQHGVAVNLQHSATIEIRLWSAIRNANDLLFFLDTMQALAQYVKRNGLDTVQKAKFTDFMKYYKLKSSVGIVKSRLRKKPHLSKFYNEVVEFENKKKGAKK